jgi:hypothetical protein
MIRRISFAALLAIAVLTAGCGSAGHSGRAAEHPVKRGA